MGATQIATHSRRIARILPRRRRRWCHPLNAGGNAPPCSPGQRLWPCSNPVAENQSLLLPPDHDDAGLPGPVRPGHQEGDRHHQRNGKAVAELLMHSAPKRLAAMLAPRPNWRSAGAGRRRSSRTMWIICSPLWGFEHGFQHNQHRQTDSGRGRPRRYWQANPYDASRSLSSALPNGCTMKSGSSLPLLQNSTAP